MRRATVTMLVFLGVFASSTALAGSVAVWPGPTVCSTTLQACINAQGPGGVVEIDTETPIAENINLPLQITLRPHRAWISPAFASGFGISGSFPGPFSDPISIQLTGLTLTNAKVTLYADTPQSVSFDVSRMQIRSTGSTAAGIDINLRGSGNQSARVSENRLNVIAPSLFDAAIVVEVYGVSTATAVEISNNQIVASQAGDGWGIHAMAGGGSAPEFRIYANKVNGDFTRDSIEVTEGMFSSTPSSVDAWVFGNMLVGGEQQRGGLSFVTAYGNIEARILNNTIVNSSGLTLLRWGGNTPPSDGTTAGWIENNLIAHTRYGLQNSASGGGTALNDYNLLWANRSPGLYTPGAHDVIANPQLDGNVRPRLSAGSPARDAGDGLIYLFQGGGIPLVDGDGLRRLAGSAVDIGASEYGHDFALARDTTAGTHNSFTVGVSRWNDNAAQRLFATQNFNAGNTSIGAPLNVDYFDQWFISSANGSNLPNGVSRLAVNVFAPYATTSSQGVFQHVANGSNTLDEGSQIDWSIINGNADAFALFQQSTPFGLTRTPDPVVLSYQGTRWNLVTAGGIPFVYGASGTSWNLYAQVRSAQAFTVTADASNSDTNQIFLDHPLLNNQPCAEIQISRLAGLGTTGSVFDVDYLDAEGRHVIYSDLGGMANGVSYNVLVLPPQIDRCSGDFPVFIDGFEN
jgi:hypothetical protein